MIHVHYSYGMALVFFSLKKKEAITTARKIFGKILSCQYLKDRRSELKDMIKDVKWRGEQLGFEN